MASSTTEGHQKHEIECYLSVKDRLDIESSNGIPVQMKTSISKILDRLSNSPAMSFTATYCSDCWGSLFLISDVPLMVGGEDAGTFGHPNIEKIVEKSQPSPFGKGDKTVMDLEYRNGREVVAKDIVIGSPMQSSSNEALYKLIEDHISASMFVGKAVKINLYKLALYGKEGHFDWHRDTTHGDNHHATVLVALNTEWKGGNLGLRYEGNTVDVDMHPLMRAPAYEEDESEEEEDGSGVDKNENAESNGARREEGDGEKSEAKPSVLGFQVLAFYTDIEHKVENITDGTRIVLQFDVSIEDGGREDDDDSDFHLGSSDKILDTMKPIFPSVGTEAKRDAIIEELAMKIKELHTSKSSVPEVVLPLRHLYRLASIKPEYLKGVDGYLYEGLKKTFEIGLKPIVLIQVTGDEGQWSTDNVFGFPFASKYEERDERPAKKRKIERKSQIHVPALCELMMIGKTDYIEYTGNEAQLGEDRYFGGGMFVAAKTAEVK